MGTRFQEILRDPKFDLIGANQIPALVIQICERASGDARSDHLLRRS